MREVRSWVVRIWEGRREVRDCWSEGRGGWREGQFGGEELVMVVVEVVGFDGGFDLFFGAMMHVEAEDVGGGVDMCE